MYNMCVWSRKRFPLIRICPSHFIYSNNTTTPQSYPPHPSSSTPFLFLLLLFLPCPPSLSSHSLFLSLPLPLTPLPPHPPPHSSFQLPWHSPFLSTPFFLPSISSLPSLALSLKFSQLPLSIPNNPLSPLVNSKPSPFQTKLPFLSCVSSSGIHSCF